MDAEILEEWGGPFDQPGYCLYKGVFSKWDPELGDEPIKVEERDIGKSINMGSIKSSPRSSKENN